MQSFKEYLLKNYSDSISNLSKTDKNPVLDCDYKLINVDKMAKDYNKNNHYLSTDALLIIKNGDKYKFQFIEFKNLDFNLNEDLKIGSTKLKNIVSLMEKCEHECNIVNETKHLSDDFVDKNIMKIRLKPIESLSIIHDFFKSFFDIGDKEASLKLFDVEKDYWLVSKTNCSINSPFSPNKSNNHRKKFKTPFDLLLRLKPYHFDEIVGINFNEFQKYIDIIGKDN